MTDRAVLGWLDALPGHRLGFAGFLATFPGSQLQGTQRKKQHVELHTVDD